jgi:hypothetical protein
MAVLSGTTIVGRHSQPLTPARREATKEAARPAIEAARMRAASINDSGKT